MRAAAEKAAERSNQGEDIERVREKSRSFLKEAKSDEALAVLNRQIDEEKAALQDRKGRTVKLLADRAEVERMRYDYGAAKGTLEELLRLDPDQFWRWIDLGTLWVTTGSVADALPAFRAAQAAGERSGNERDVFAAVSYVGDVLVDQGNLTAPRRACPAPPARRRP